MISVHVVERSQERIRQERAVMEGSPIDTASETIAMYRATFASRHMSMFANT